MSYLPLSPEVSDGPFLTLITCHAKDNFDYQQVPYVRMS